MERNRNTNRFTDYLAVIERIKNFHGIDIQPVIVEEYTFDCLKELGSVAINRKDVELEVVDYKIDNDSLPCDIYNIISIVELPEWVKNNDRFRDNNFERNKNYISPAYGEFIDYVFDEDGLRFNVTNLKVNIEYDSLKLDSDGIIIFPEDLLPAVCAYVINKYDYAQWRAGKINASIYQESLRLKGIEMRKAKAFGFNRNYLDKAVKQMYSYNKNRYFY